MLYESYISGSDKAAFLSKVKEVAGRLGFNPDWLMGIMRAESNFKAQAVNPYSNATGLIQFMPATALSLGTSVQALYIMSRVQQMYYVEQYYKAQIKAFGMPSNIVQAYMLTFYPVAMKKPYSFIIGSERSMSYAKLVYEQNKALDYDKDGYISVGDFANYVKARMPEFFAPGYRDNTDTDTTQTAGFGIFAGLFLLGAWLSSFRKGAK